MPPKRDRHIYKLEAEFSGPSGHHTATVEALEQLLFEVCAYYGVTEPPLRFVNTRKDVNSAWYDHDIVLNRAREGANGWALLHEVAHYLIDQFYDEYDHHGPAWVAIYMHLLDHWSYLPNTCFRLLAKKHRVRIGRRYRPCAFAHL